MATHYPDIPNRGFSDRFRFRSWLESLDEEQRRIISPTIGARVAQRCSVFLVSAKNEELFKYVTLTVFRCNSISNLGVENNDFFADHTHDAKVGAGRGASAGRGTRDAGYSIAGSVAALACSAASEAAADAEAAYMTAPGNYFANHYAAAAADIYAAVVGSSKDFWLALTGDVQMLLGGDEPAALKDKPLWPQGVPQWWNRVFEDLKAALQEEDRNAGVAEWPASGWQVWTEWLQSRIDGTPSWGLSAQSAQELEERIALGDGRLDFLQREPEAVNAEIAGWLREKGWGGPKKKRETWDFFLSYNEDDLDDAKFISGVLEDNGFSVYSQFNDFRNGNFIDLMNKGLEGMARFLPVYSPSYFDSNACKGEYQAALTFDPSGNTGKIIPFMVRVSTPPPLLRGVLYYALYNLPAERKAEAIIHAVTKPVSPRDRAAQRFAAKGAVSPDVMPDQAGRRIDSGKNIIFDDVYADTDLFDLPERMRQIVYQLRELLRDKNCTGIKMCLDAIDGELSARGLDCSIGLLADQIELIDVDLASGSSSLLSSDQALVSRFLKLSELFATMRSLYPLDQKREAILRQAEVEIKKPEQMEEIYRQVSEVVQNACNEDLVTDQYQKDMQNRLRVSRDILSIPDPVVLESSDLSFVAREEDRLVRVRTAKRRALAQDAAVADKTVEVAASIVTIADSTAGKALIEVMKRLGNWIWSG